MKVATSITSLENSYWCTEKNIYVSTYQLCRFCLSCGRAASGCYGKPGAASHIMAQKPQTNIMNQGRTKL
jgi:transcription termination factor Rho